MTCPNISFQTSPSGANNAHGSQTMNLTTGIKTITCDDGPSGIGALLSFKYNDGNDAGLQGVRFRFLVHDSSVSRGETTPPPHPETGKMKKFSQWFSIMFLPKIFENTQGSLL
jgi:hypothetical protein